MRKGKTERKRTEVYQGEMRRGGERGEERGDKGGRWEKLDP